MTATSERAADRLAARLAERTPVEPMDSLRRHLERLAQQLGANGPAWIADVALTLPGLDRDAAAARAGYVPAGALLGRAVDEMPHARTTDPGTSHAAAQNAPRRMRAGTQLAHLLAIYAGRPEDDAGLTAEEACDLTWGATEGAVRPSWRRVSDLKTRGLLEDTGAVRKGTSGLDAEVLRLTEAGRWVAAALAEQGASAATW